MSEYSVEFYAKSNGEEPVREFLLDLDHNMVREIGMLETNGPTLREPDSKPLGDGIFELRAKLSSSITRVLYFFYVGKKIILTNGFVKKTQKTPTREIDIAKKYRDDYLSRKEAVK